MKTFYFTFGQIHVHSVNGKTFDKDCVVQIDVADSNPSTARKIMAETFGDKWSMQYDKKEVDEKHPDFFSYFPRGVMEI